MAATKLKHPYQVVLKLAEMSELYNSLRALEKAWKGKMQHILVERKSISLGWRLHYWTLTCRPGAVDTVTYHKDGSHTRHPDSRGVTKEEWEQYVGAVTAIAKKYKLEGFFSCDKWSPKQKFQCNLEVYIKAEEINF